MSSEIFPRKKHIPVRRKTYYEEKSRDILYRHESAHALPVSGEGGGLIDKQELGKNGEDEAAQFLLEQGFDILERNYRCGRAGEMDIIARKENLVVFAEVKSRGTPLYGGALFSIGSKKRNSLKTIARQYMTRSNLPGSVIFRFDLIAIENGEITWTRDIIR